MKRGEACPAKAHEEADDSLEGQESERAVGIGVLCVAWMNIGARVNMEIAVVAAESHQDHPQQKQGCPQQSRGPEPDRIMWVMLSDKMLFVI